MGWKLAAESASVMLVPLPPKSSSATIPLSGSPGLVFSAARAETASDTSAGGTPFGDRFGLVRNIARSAPSTAGPQCAGTAIATCEGDEASPTVWAIASKASTSNLSA